MRPTLPRAPRRAEQKIRSSGVVVSCLQKSEGFGTERTAKVFNRRRCGISATPLLLHIYGERPSVFGSGRDARGDEPPAHIPHRRFSPSPVHVVRQGFLPGAHPELFLCQRAHVLRPATQLLASRRPSRRVREESCNQRPSLSRRPAAHRDGRRNSGATPVHTRLFPGPSQMQKPAKRPCPAADQRNDQCSQRPTPRPDWSNSKGRPGAPRSRVAHAQVSVGDTRERLCALGHTAATASPTAV